MLWPKSQKRTLGHGGHMFWTHRERVESYLKWSIYQAYQTARSIVSLQQIRKEKEDFTL